MGSAPVGKVAERLHEEKPQRSDTLLNRGDGQVFLLQQMNLKPPDMLRSKAIRRLAEILGEVSDRRDVASHGTIRIISTLEFLQHHFA